MNGMMMMMLGLLGVVVIWQVYLLLNKPKDEDVSDAKQAQKEIEKEDTIRYAREGLDNKTRNIIVLLVMLLIVVVVIVFVHRRIVKNKTTTDKMITKLENELDGLKSEQSRKTQVEEKLEKIREEVFFNNKQMPSIDTTTQTLQYFFSLSEKYSRSMQFDFVLADSGFVETDAAVKYNKYLITGTSYMNQVFSFIDQIERQPAFYTVESVALNSMAAEEKGKVMFSLEVFAYYAPDGVNPEEINVQRLKKRRLAYNPFYHRIHEPINYEDDEFMKLLDIENAEVVALSGERVFIRDGRNGIIYGLNIGDRVRYGYLENINWEEQIAIFRLTRYGVPERIKKVMVHNN